MHNLIFKGGSLAPFVYRKAARQVPVFVVNLPGAAIPYNETKCFKLPFGKSEREGRTQGDCRQLQFFTGRNVADNPRTILTLLRHCFFSKFFVSKLSPSKLEKNATSQNAKLCDIRPLLSDFSPPTPRGGAFRTRRQHGEVRTHHIFQWKAAVPRKSVRQNLPAFLFFESIGETHLPPRQFPAQ